MLLQTGAARFLLLAVLVAAAAAGAGAWVATRYGDAGDQVQLRSGTWLPEPRPVASFALTATDGSTFTDQKLRGHPSLLFFGFTHCPDVCPTTMALLAQVRRDVPSSDMRGTGFRVVLVSVDPQRDDVPSLGRYVQAFDPHFIGVTGEAPQLAALAKSLGAVYQRHDLPGGDYTMDHSATLYLLDGQGRLAAVFTPPFDRAALGADLSTAVAAFRRGEPAQQ